MTLYHGVHGEVVVLGLQLHSMLVTSAYLSVALQEHFLVVADPVKHLHTRHRATLITLQTTGCHTFMFSIPMSTESRALSGTNRNHLP